MTNHAELIAVIEAIIIGTFIGLPCGIGISLLAAERRDGIQPDTAAILILGCMAIGACSGFLEYLL